MKTLPSPPPGWSFRAWNTGVECDRCGIVFDGVAPTVEQLKENLWRMMADHDAKEHPA